MKILQIILFVSVAQHYAVPLEVLTVNLCQPLATFAANCGDGHTVQLQEILWGRRLPEGSDVNGCGYKPNDCNDVKTTGDSLFSDFQTTCGLKPLCTFSASHRITFMDSGIGDCYMKESQYMRFKYTCLQDQGASTKFSSITSPITQSTSKSTESFSTASTARTVAATETSTRNNPNDTSGTDSSESYTDMTSAATKPPEISPISLGEHTGGQLDDEDMTAMIAGSVAGGILLLVIIIMVIILVLRKKKVKSNANNNTISANSKTSTNPAYIPDCDGVDNDSVRYACISNNYFQTQEISTASDTYVEIKEDVLDNKVFKTKNTEQDALYAQTNVINKSETEENKKFAEATGEITDMYAQPDLSKKTSKDISLRKNKTVDESKQSKMTDDNEKSPVEIGDSGVIYAQPDKSKKRNNTSKLSENKPDPKMEGDIYSEVNKPKRKQKLTMLIKNPTNKLKTVVPSDKELEIPHQSIEGDLYAQPVKIKTKDNTENEEVEIRENDIG